MALVEEYYIGSTKIRIYDDAYINRTPEEIEQTYKRIAEIVMRSRARQALEKKRKEEALKIQQQKEQNE